MTNPKQNRDFVCLTWARWPGVTVCRVGSSPWWSKFLLEEEPIPHDKQLRVSFVVDSSFIRWEMCCYFLNVLCHDLCVFVSLCTPLSCLRWVSKVCKRSMRLDTPCSRVSRVWCWGSWPEKLSLKLRRASLTSCSSSPYDTASGWSYSSYQANKYGSLFLPIKEGAKMLYMIK